MKRKRNRKERVYINNNRNIKKRFKKGETNTRKEK